MKRFVILIADDFELMGEGFGNVADLQYLPALALMNIASKYNAKITFMVEVAQQLVFREHISIPDIRIQKNLWDETVLLMKDRGFDVQLQIHCQWANAFYNSGHFYLSDNWNIGCCDHIVQNQLITGSVQYLHSLLLPRFPDYNICAFKAGNWGLQPSANLISELKKVGIKIILGARGGMKIPSQSTDFTEMEEIHLPYYAHPDDITKLSNKNGPPIVIPLQSYDPDLLTLSTYFINHMVDKIRYKNNLQYYHVNQIPAEVKNLTPNDIRNCRFSIRPYRTHLKIGNQPFSYLKKSFDTVINKLRRFNVERIPVFIESHTKQFQNHYKEIDRFIAYIAEYYESEAEFSDMSSYCKDLIENPGLARWKNVARPDTT